MNINRLFMQWDFSELNTSDGEIDMLDRLETKGIVLSTYNRYRDDITAISDVREKMEKGKLFLILEDGLNKLDPIGNIRSSSNR